ncbi:MAG: hypothetical protein ACSI46_09325 [Gloeotrichia echinulata DVL01]|nr:hypothetical protein [Gloeotrichia echinulata DEX184]
MDLAKLILLACPVFLASMLWLVNPAQASSLKSGFSTQIITVASVQEIPQLTMPKLHQASDPLIAHLGCNCGNCVQSKFQMLQGKLPSARF